MENMIILLNKRVPNLKTHKQINQQKPKKTKSKTQQFSKHQMDPHTTCGEGGGPAGAADWEAISNQKRSKETLKSGFGSAEQRIGVGKGGGGVDPSGT